MGKTIKEQIADKKELAIKVVENLLRETTKEKLEEIITRDFYAAVKSEFHQLLGVRKSFGEWQVSPHSPLYSKLEEIAEDIVQDFTNNYTVELTQKEKKILEEQYHSTYFETLKDALRNRAESDAIAAVELIIPSALSDD